MLELGTASTGTSGLDTADELKRRSAFGLDFFVADMLTGFGRFVTIYLAANGWHPTGIGFALSVGTMAAVAGQVPAGMLVDAVPLKRLIVAAGIAAIIISVLVLGTYPARWTVGAEIILGGSASLLTPAIAAVTLALSKSEKFAERLGKAPQRTAHPTASPRYARKEPLRRRRELSRDHLLLTFMFQLSNAAVLPFAVSAIQDRGVGTDMLASIALVVSLAVVASPLC